MRFLPRVAPHVHHQHVLSLERFLLPTAFLPATDEHLLVGLYVIYIYMLQWKINSIQSKVNSQNKHLMKLCTQTIYIYSQYLYKKSKIYMYMHLEIQILQHSKALWCVHIIALWVLFSLKLLYLSCTSFITNENPLMYQGAKYSIIINLP